MDAAEYGMISMIDDGIGEVLAALDASGLADCPEYEGMQGNSRVSLLDRPEGSLRDHVLVEEDEMFDLALLGQPLRMRTLVTEQARLTLYRGTDEGELYDLQSDPGELNNLFARRESRALRAHMLERLARLQMEYADSSPTPKYVA